MSEDIVGTWVVEALGGRPTTEPRPELTFDADGRLSGRTGVNRVMGPYVVRDGVLAVGPAATTRRAGPPAAMEQEQRLLEVLDVPQPLARDRQGRDRLVLGEVEAEPVAVLARVSSG